MILLLGRWAARLAARLLRRVLARREVEQTLVSFFGDLSYFALLVLVIIAALSQLGVQTASMVAAVGAAGLAIALSLRGSLSNFAAGVLLILFRPFKSGDYIEGAGTSGTVDTLNVLSTRLVTPDNRTIFIPNAKLLDDTIVNYSINTRRRMDLVFGVGYEQSIDRVRTVLSTILSGDERVLKEPPPQIAVKELADSSVNFLVRIWTLCEDYWDVQFDTIEEVKKRFDDAGISIPYPQRDVHFDSTIPLTSGPTDAAASD
jgi:small conductance mechanosensitive channel